MIAFVLQNAKFLIAGMLLTLNSSFGQTFFISIFAAQIMASYALTDGEWGILYTLGTTASAIVMFWVGALTDHFRARSLAWFIMPGLAGACVAMAYNTSVLGLVAVVFFLRVLGQGMIFQLATVSMARWFASRRGTALSISGMGFWLGQASLPPIFAFLLLRLDWHFLWLVAAAIVLASFPIVLWLLKLERTPQSLAQEIQSVGMGERHWTRRDVLRSRFFWMLAPLLIGLPAWGTALLFQQVHIAEVKGWPLVDYLALIPMMTLVAVAVTLTTGAAVDRFGSGLLLKVFPLFWIAGFVLLTFASTLLAAALAFIVFGIATGMQATLITAFWAEYFGTRHLGAIKATSASIMVLGSALGPGISGQLIDWGFSFPDQMLGIAVYFALSMALVWVAVGAADKTLAPKVNVERT